MSREFVDADSSGCLPKSEFSRDFQSTDHTALFGPQEPETQFETPNPFPSVVSPRTSVFIHSFREWSSAYLFLHWIMVLWLTNSSLPSGQPRLWEGS
ncbi:hypothetical protein AVEN_25301-1 [Araneus ventricosus]|uniref:Uncharacterized protein n=1 Tax=Araneus ventricosus TaxID=182803 RepID=A0A4Y2PS72_ARAVE|nr:hypothetical protein AVEN_25301-1 [Araneus ventricosus]